MLKFPEVDPLNPPVFVLNDVAFGYSKDKEIFKCLNLNANLESRICIVSDRVSVATLRRLNNDFFLFTNSMVCRWAKMEPVRQHC